jgi:type IV pilus assembly protein PilC
MGAAPPPIFTLSHQLEPLLIVFMGVAIGLCLAGIFPLLYGSLSGLEN